MDSIDEIGDHENIGPAIIWEALDMQLEELNKGNKWESASVTKEDNVTEEVISIEKLHIKIILGDISWHSKCKE